MVYHAAGECFFFFHRSPPRPDYLSIDHSWFFLSFVQNYWRSLAYLLTYSDLDLDFGDFCDSMFLLFLNFRAIIKCVVNR
jgi:hypothetical protein